MPTDAAARLWTALAVLGAAGFSLVATLAWREIARRRGWVDWPDARRLHVTPTPRGGGIGIVIVVLAALAADRSPEGRLLLAGFATIAAGGLWDDLRPLPAAAKAGIQAVGAALIALALPLASAPGGAIGAVLAAWLLTMVVVNFWNFMDGSNGLAASQGGLLAATAAALALAAVPGWPVVLLPALALAAGCLGFLPLNLPGGRVFLGDVGSQAIGAALVLLALRVAAAADAGTGWVLWLPPSAFLLDAGLTLAGRLRRREKVWQGHRLHLYQRAIAAGASHVAVCGIYALWTTLACTLAAWIVVTGYSEAGALVAAVYVIGMLVYVALGRRWPRSMQGRNRA